MALNNKETINLRLARPSSTRCSISYLCDCVCVCVCERERERTERERQRETERERETQWKLGWSWFIGTSRQGWVAPVSVCVCVCVCQTEREKNWEARPVNWVEMDSLAYWSTRWQCVYVRVCVCLNWNTGRSGQHQGRVCTSSGRETDRWTERERDWLGGSHMTLQRSV